MKTLFITPKGKSDYLANTVIDGFLQIQSADPDIKLVFPDYEYPCPYRLDQFKMNESDIIQNANEFDFIILFWGKGATNFDLASKINKWDKTIFIDGSELGKNNRFDKDIVSQVQNLEYGGNGAINKEMLERCALYFRREKPYIRGIISLPFGIESRYLSEYNNAVKKDIDFCCIFGQEDYPKLRKDVRKYLEKFCKRNSLVCATAHTKDFNFDDNTKLAGRQQFYNLLARSKVGISIGGGGFDTARFWETLGNNCILLTEKIDIFENSRESLPYDRIKEFGNLAEFEILLDKTAKYLQNEYHNTDFVPEYERILKEQGTKSRVETILDKLRKKKII